MNIDYPTIKSVLRGWFPKPIRINFPISVDDPLIIKYRMTLGSIYYSSKKQDIVMDLPKDPEMDNLSQTMDFLKIYHPRVLNLWQAIKRDTEQHLNYIANLWMKYLIFEVDNIISLMITKYLSLVSYNNSKTPEPYYVRNNIIEGLYKEIEYIALTGNEIGLFQFNPSMGMVGNALLFVKSSNEKLLMQFMDLLSKALHNENVISEFRNAETKKAEVESKVLDFKQELQNIMIRIP